MLSESTIKHEINGYRVCRNRILEQRPDLDDETLRDTLEGITDLPDMIAELIRSSLADQAMVAGLKGRLEDMRERLARLEACATKKRQLALDALVEVDIKKLTQPDFTVSVRAGTPALSVIAEDEIPEDFWVPQPPKLDRQAILAALKSGKSIAGASLNNSQPTLAVRTK